MEMPLVTRVIVEAPRWLFLLALVYAPWVYGTTPAWAIAYLDLLLLLIIALWLVGARLRRMPPAVPTPLVWCVGIILISGWAMALNPHYVADPTSFRFVVHKPPLPGLPGTVDGPVSLVMMERITCLLGIVCFVCDLSARRIWRRRIWHTIGATGASVVLFGLVQSAFAQPIFFWRPDDIGEPYFATYYYHGNAGSFINLVMPFVAGLAALTMRRPDAHVARAVWFPGFFVCVAGAFVNLSRSAMVITGLICVLLLVWQFTGKSRNELLPRRRVRIAYALLMAGAVACLVAFAGWERPAQKWAQMESQLNSSNKRLVSMRVCMRMVPDAGWHGFGPGTFGLVFPHYTGKDADLIPGIWRYAHNDYMQTVLEWGWLGALVWAALYFGGMARIWIHWRKRWDLSTSDHVLLLVTGLALAGVSAHALVDFPLQIASLQLYAGVCVAFGWGSGAWEGTLASRT
jgi:O-antigen ligase